MRVSVNQRYAKYAALEFSETMEEKLESKKIVNQSRRQVIESLK